MNLTCKHCGTTGTPQISINGPHLSAYCRGCGVFIKHVPQDPVKDDFVLYFGKYKGRNVKSMVGSTPEEFKYLCWLRDNATVLKEQQMLILQNITK